MAMAYDDDDDDDEANRQTIKEARMKEKTRDRHTLSNIEAKNERPSKLGQISDTLFPCLYFPFSLLGRFLYSHQVLSLPPDSNKHTVSWTEFASSIPISCKEQGMEEGQKTKKREARRENTLTHENKEEWRVQGSEMHPFKQKKSRK
mmetsp:Transcript_31098/g.61332  ORF Transcript_31098/g.61332 Transcript_31098/m.61332 type:complete len:147 (+) Transcript_31098:229-669(+)